MADSRPAALAQYYTEFMMAAKALLAGHDCKMMVDVMMPNSLDPEKLLFLNIYLDWRRWFSFADGVSFKHVELESDAYAVFKALADRHALPTYYNEKPPIKYKEWPQERIIGDLRRASAAGHRGYMLYEACNIMHARPDGSFDIIFPQVPEVIVPTVREMNEGTN